MMYFYYAGSFFLPFMVSLILVPLTKWYALKRGFIDVPAARKVHQSPVPLGGGIAVFFSVVLTALAAMVFADFHIPRTIVGLFAGAFLLIIVGLLGLPHLPEDLQPALPQATQSARRPSPPHRPSRPRGI